MTTDSLAEQQRRRIRRAGLAVEGFDAFDLDAPVQGR
jgi:hypothetical protein